ncbi:MAG: ribonuclease P protein component [Bacteroidales bacterium]|jgi:ribonuclease P protein component|nr:ribonuclease P protein component [Bacteroidales bacterium]
MNGEAISGVNASFPKSERLCSKIVIDDLFARGESRRSGGFTVKYVRVHTDEDMGLPKILISVPKRFQKHAVDRNRTKRLIREVYRKHKAEHLSESHISSLAIIYSSPKVPDYTFVEEHLPKLLDKIK